MQEKVLKNVLAKIGTGKEHDAAPDQEYLKALETIGFIEMGWDNSLTSLGRRFLNILQDDDWS